VVVVVMLVLLDEVVVVTVVLGRVVVVTPLAKVVVLLRVVVVTVVLVVSDGSEFAEVFVARRRDEAPRSFSTQEVVSKVSASARKVADAVPADFAPGRVPQKIPML
jgi:hypothetical protein